MNVEVGMGTTYVVGSDRYPATVVKVLPKTVTVTMDSVTVVGVLHGVTQFGFTSNEPTPENTKVFTLRQNGKWVQQGAPMHSACTLHLGDRSYYLDPHF